MTFDTQLFYLLNNPAGQSPIFDGIVVFLASYLPYLLLIIFLVLAFFSKSPKWEKLELLLVAGISSIVARYGITELIRFFYHHPRPFMVLPMHQLLAKNSWSFPSGHAAFFFAIALA